MYGIYANIGGILMVNVTIYIAYMDPMGNNTHLRLILSDSSRTIRPSGAMANPTPSLWAQHRSLLLQLVSLAFLQQP